MGKNEQKNEETGKPEGSVEAVSTDAGLQIPQVASKRRLPAKNRVKVVQFMQGIDLLGSAMSKRASKELELEATAVGIRMLSKGTGRIIIVPYSNVKGFELFPEEDAA